MSNTIEMQCRLGKDPETRDVGDTTVTKLWVAESERFKRKDGEQVVHTNWWSLEIWGKSGETVAKYFSKGDGIKIVGSAKITEKDDNKYYAIRVNQWEFPLSRKGDGGESPAAKASGVADTPGDDEVPF